MNKKQKTFIPVSVIIPMRNAMTTLEICLKSVVKQKYPIKDIIIVDNASTDRSVAVAERYAKKSKIPITIIARKKNKGVGASYNAGIRKSKAKLVVLMHSDSELPTAYEIERLTLPLRQSDQVVAAYPTNLLPFSVWNTYNFWQKRHQVRAVEKDCPGMNTKFDCINKKIFFDVGGFDDKHFGEDKGNGAQDADMYLRLKEKGEVVLSKAKVIHLHYLGGTYSLGDFISNRKLFARTYGSLIRVRGRSLPLSTKGIGLQIPLGVFIFMVKPALAILPFLPSMQVVGVVLLVLYAFLNAGKMYTTRSTLADPRILILPFIDIFLVYYETFWQIEAIITTKEHRK